MQVEYRHPDLSIDRQLALTTAATRRALPLVAERFAPAVRVTSRQTYALRARCGRRGVGDAGAGSGGSSRCQHVPDRTMSLLDRAVGVVRRPVASEGTPV